MSGDPVDRLHTVVPAELLSTFAVPDLGQRPLVAPRELDQWTELFAFAHSERLRVLPMGLASKESWTNPAEGVDLVVSTKDWNDVVAYEPGDGTLTARAGATMDSLAALVRTGGHHLSPCVPHPDASTLGGVLAAGQSGFDRLRYGPVRNNLLGMRVVLCDGRVSKSGGALVKNVTGYDLHRAYCGSFGTLAVVIEASLRLHPLPANQCVVRHTVSARDAALRLAREVVLLPVKATSVTLDDLDGAGWALTVVLEGREDVLEWEAKRVLEVLEGATTLEGESAAREIERLRDLELYAGGWPELVLHTLPSVLPQLLSKLSDQAETLGLAMRTLVHAGVAGAAIWLDGSPDAMGRLNAELSDGSARLHWQNAPAELRGVIDAFGPTSTAIGQMKKLRDGLDPEGTFARGRFHGGL